MTTKSSNISNSGAVQSLICLCDQCWRNSKHTVIRFTVRKLDKIWKDILMAKSTKVRLMSFSVSTIFLYGVKTWTHRSKDRRALNVVLESHGKNSLDCFSHQYIHYKEFEKQRKTVQLRIPKFFGHSPGNDFC